MEKGPRFDLTVSQLMGDIMQLGILINHMTEHAVFIDYSGHVESLRVQIYQTKETTGKDPVTKDDMYVNAKTWVHPDDVIKKLTRLKMQLRKIAHNKKIKKSDLFAEERIVYDYHLI